MVVLKGLVDLKEMADFLKAVRRKLRHILIAVIVRVVDWNGNDFFIAHSAVRHLQHADRLAFNNGHRSYLLAAKHKDIQRVVIACICARNEAVVCRIVG